MDMAATCFECGRAFEAVPSDFVYSDPGAGWYQDPANGHVGGYCGECAALLARLHHEDIRSGRWDQRDMEDELWGIYAA